MSYLSCGTCRAGGSYIHTDALCTLRLGTFQVADHQIEVIEPGIGSASVHDVSHHTTDVTNSKKFPLKCCVVVIVVSLLYRIYHHNLHALIASVDSAPLSA
jgi:hypothetical protein